MKSFEIIAATMIMVLLISFPISAVEADIGGEIKTISNLILSDDGVEQFNIQELLNMELYLPRSERTSASFEFNLAQDLTGESQFNLKKLYLKQKFNDFHLTLGRQPISWSFGSLINPVDFMIGAEVMDESTPSKYQDAVRLYLPLNWSSGVEVISAPNYELGTYNGTKWGLRARTTWEGFDISGNYVRDEKLTDKDRLGISVKGDLGPLGSYSALSYTPREGEDDQYIYLAGLDYSRLINYSQRLYLQGEIINLKAEELMAMMSNMDLGILGDSGEGEIPEIILEKERLNLLLGNINYNLSNFSQLGLIMVSSLDDGSFMINPRYSNQLPGNLTLEISGTLLQGQTGDLLQGDMIPFQVSFSYPF